MHNPVTSWLMSSMETQAERDASFKERLETSEKFRKHTVHVWTMPQRPVKWWQNKELQSQYFEHKVAYVRGFGKLKEANSVRTSLLYHQHLVEQAKQES